LVHIILSTILKKEAAPNSENHFMNHLESGYTGKNSFWRYIVMLVTVFFIANLVGSIPLLILFIVKSAGNPEAYAKIAANPTDFGAMGFDPIIGLILLVIPFVFCLFAFILLVKPLHQRTFKQSINGTNSIRWNRFFISGAVWFVLCLIYLLVCIKFDPSNFQLNNTSVTLVYLIVVVIIMIPFQASFEEVIFRGYLMQGLAVLANNRWFPLLVTSILFASMHSANPEVKAYGFFTMMPQYFFMALTFGIASLLDDGIEVAMGAHAANNIFISIFTAYSSSALQTPALYVQKTIYPWTDFAATVISAVIFIAALAVILKWKNVSSLWSKVRKRTESVQTL
jgi:uncharacterized protein